MRNHQRERALKWVDLREEKEEKKPLAKLIPILDTIDFKKSMDMHEKQSYKEVPGCLREQKKQPPSAKPMTSQKSG